MYVCKLPTIYRQITKRYHPQYPLVVNQVIFLQSASLNCWLDMRDP